MCLARHFETSTVLVRDILSCHEVAYYQIQCKVASLFHPYSALLFLHCDWSFKLTLPGWPLHSAIAISAVDKAHRNTQLYCSACFRTRYIDSRDLRTYLKTKPLNETRKVNFCTCLLWTMKAIDSASKPTQPFADNWDDRLSISLRRKIPRLYLIFAFRLRPLKAHSPKCGRDQRD